MFMPTRVSWRALLALAAVFALVLTLGAPAMAADDIYEDNGGIPGSADYSGGGRHVTGGIVYVCDRDGNLVRDDLGIIVYDGPHIGCRVRNAVATSTVRMCQPSMQVFRFYGTVANPVVGWSTSMAAQSKWCDPMRALMWSTSAYDNQDSVNADNFDKEALGTVSHPDLGHVPQLDSLNARGYNMHPMYALRWTLRNAPDRITTGRAFGGNQRCAASQNGSNPIENDLRNTLIPLEDRQDIVEKLSESFHKTRTRFRRTYGVSQLAALKAAQKLEGLISWNQGRASARFVDQDCASAMQYITTADVSKINQISEQRNYRVTGVCYIPVERMARVYERRVNGRVVGRDYGFTTIKNFGYGGGLRYSNFYQGTKGTASNPLFNDHQLPDRFERNILNTWRDRMELWYRANTTRDVYSLYTGKTQTLPADPYVMADARRRIPNPAAIRYQGYNRDKAARALRNFSRCKFGPNVYYNTSGEVVDENPEGTSGLVIRNQPVMQSGGYGAPAQGFTIKDKGLRCTRECDGSHVEFKSLGHTTTVRFPDGWDVRALDDPEDRDPGEERSADVWIADTQGVSSADLSCSGNECTIRVAANESRSEVDVEMRMFQPTSGDERVEATLSGVQAEYDYVKKTTIRVGTETVTVSTPATAVDTSVKVTGAPVGLSENASAGTWTFRMPVIGAVSVR